MKIYCLFIIHKSEPESPELLEAWDEYSIDSNPEGWSDVCRDRLKGAEGDYTHSGVVKIEVSEAELLDRIIPSSESLQGQVL